MKKLLVIFLLYLLGVSTSALAAYTPPAGTNGQLQYNNSGAFGGLNIGTGLANSLGALVATGSSLPTPASPVGSIQYNASGVTGGLANGTAAQTALTGLIGHPKYYAVNYGVKADGQTLTDVTTTASSATVCSASYQFVAGDVGKGTYISAGTAIPLAASTTVSGTTSITTPSLTGLGVNITMEVIGTGIQSNTQVTAVLNSTTLQVFPPPNASGTVTVTVVPFVTNLTISSISTGCAVLSGTVPTSMSGNAKMVFATIDTGNASTGWIGVMNAAAADPVGGVVVVPNGISMSGPFTVPANALNANGPSMVGSGWGKSVIRWFSTADETAPLIGGNTGGGCTPALLGRWNNNSFSNFEIDMSGATNAAVNVGLKGLTVNCASQGYYDHMYIHDSLATCFATDYPHNIMKTSNLVVDCGRGAPGVGHNGYGDGTRYDDPNESETFIGNTCINCGRVAFLVENEIGNNTSSAKVIITGNYGLQQNQYSLTGACIDDGSIGGSITGNRCTGPFDTANGETVNWDGIRSTTATIGDAGGSGTVITGNSIDSVNNCIVLNESGGGSAIPSYAIVGNNRCARGAGVGIFLTADNTNVFNGVDLDHNSISDFGNAGIRFTTGGAHFQNVSIEGGIIANNGKTGATTLTQAGIDIEAPIDGLTIQGVRAFDNETGTQLYAIANKTSNTNTNVYITKNNFVGNATGMMATGGTFDGEIFDNLGSSPPTITGTCTATSITGNADIGSFVLGVNGTFSCVIKPYANVVDADHGYVAFGNDLTTPTATITQSGSAQTTYTITGTGTSGDTINYFAKPW